MIALQLFTFVLWSFCGSVLAADNGLTDLVSWDEYSVTINGTRQWILSGEFHYPRLPVPELWPDILQKFKAHGFNAISLYFFWSFHSAEQGQLDFETGAKNIQRLFDYAKEAGLYVIARPGPYCNAETNAGGLALWGSDGRMGSLRTSDEAYHKAWAPFIEEITKIIADNQITNGGPVILAQVENEYQQTRYEANHTNVIYMKQLQETYRESGIVVPLTHNEKGMRSTVSWSTDYNDVGGAVDMYALDSYPGALSCTNNQTGFNVARTYYQWFQKASWTQPGYLAEFEGGWFSAWGDDTFYDSCFTEHSPEFADVYYKNNLGQRVTLLNIYMTYGGTNWGHSAAPVVYSSYDYSAPLRETRQIWSKLSQIKLIGLFTRVSEDLTQATMAGNGTGYSVSSNDAWSWVLKNHKTNATFTILQQNNTQSTSEIDFTVFLNTSQGCIEAPTSLHGRQSRILVTDYVVGSKTLLYATTDILTYASFDTEVIVFYTREGQSGEFAFKDGDGVSFEIFGDSSANRTKRRGKPAFSWTQAKGKTVVKFSNGFIAYLLDQETAWTFWAPPTTGNPTVKPSEQIFVIGPYLVRSAKVSNNELYISGDSDTATTIEAYTGLSIDTVVWNGRRLAAQQTEYGSITAKIPGAEDRSVTLPSLEDWTSADSAPEIAPDYDDSNWTECNKTETLNPYEPVSYPVLYSSNYGFYVGTKIYRGYFDGSNASAVEITCSGGRAFGWNAWLNGKLIGGDVGEEILSTTNATLKLSSDALKKTDNVLTVIVDYHGHDQTSTDKGLNNPRGILGAVLHPQGTARNTGFKTWKIQGNAGGSKNIDPVRGPMNEGGLYGERMGWHLPKFDPKGWDQDSSPQEGIAKAGIKFYTTSFDLGLDPDLDVPLGLEFSAPEGTVARVMFWINGYQYGKYLPHIGPQNRFPVPPGIINNRGKNYLALSLWAQTDAGAKLDEVKLISYGQYQTQFKFSQDWSYLQPEWENREKYA